MSPIHHKSPQDPELARKIAELRKAIARAESRGQYDTCHHEMLARLLKPEAKELEDAKQDLS